MGRPRKAIDNTGPVVRIDVWFAEREGDEPHFAMDGQPCAVEDVAERFGISHHAILSRARRKVPPEAWFLSPLAFRRWSDDQRQAA
jgi:hypothetical protein